MEESLVDNPDDITTTPPEEQESDKPEPEAVPAAEVTPPDPVPETRRPALYRLRPPGLRPRGVTRPRRRRGIGHNLAVPGTLPRPKPRSPRERGPR